MAVRSPLGPGGWVLNLGGKEAAASLGCPHPCPPFLGQESQQMLHWLQQHATVKP